MTDTEPALVTYQLDGNVALAENTARARRALSRSGYRRAVAAHAGNRTAIDANFADRLTVASTPPIPRPVPLPDEPEKPPPPDPVSA